MKHYQLNHVCYKVDYKRARLMSSEIEIITRYNDGKEVKYILANGDTFRQSADNLSIFWHMFEGERSDWYATKEEALTELRNHLVRGLENLNKQ